MPSEYVSLQKMSLRIWASVVLAAGLLILSLMLMGSPAQAELATGSISGTVTYYGGVPGSHYVSVAVFTATNATPVTYTVFSGSGDYTFTGLEDDTYYVHATIDTDGSGGPPTSGDAFAWYDPSDDGDPDPVAISGNTVTGVDIDVGGPWVSTGGPLSSGGYVHDLSVRPNVSGTLYAVVGVPANGAATEIYKTVDGAANWTAVYTSNEKHNAVAVTGTLVYAVGQGGYPQDLIVQSDSGGDEWTQVFTGTDGYWHQFNDVAINPVTPTTVYAAGVERGQSGLYTGVVYESKDDGVSWTRTLTEPAGGSSASFYALAINPITPTTVYVAGFGSDSSDRYRVIYRYNGANWTQVYSQTEDDAGFRFNALLVHPLTPTIIYAGTDRSNGYLYRSTDEGANWNRVLTDTAGRLLAFDVPNTVYAIGGCSTVYSSTVGGGAGTWQQDETSLPCIRSFAVDLEPTPSALYAGTDDFGIYKGGSWAQSNNGIQVPVYPRDIDVDPQNLEKLFVAAACGGGWMTVNGGQTYSQPSGISGCMDAFAINPEDSDIVYGGANDCSRGAVVRSGDGGLNFTPVYTAHYIVSDCSAGGEEIHDVVIAPSLTSTIYAAGHEYPNWTDHDAVVVRSQNDGITWTKVFTLPGWSAVEVLAVDPTDADTVYAGGRDCSSGSCEGFIYRTTKGGDNYDWTLVFTVTDQTVESIVVDPQEPDVIYASDTSYRIYKSTAGGDHGNWDVIRRPPWEEEGDVSGDQLAIDPCISGRVYLGGPGYIAESTDGGQTWSGDDDPIDRNTPSMAPGSLAVDNGTVVQTLYAGFNGLWSYRRAAPGFRIYLPLVMRNAGS